MNQRGFVAQTQIPQLYFHKTISCRLVLEDCVSDFVLTFIHHTLRVHLHAFQIGLKVANKLVKNTSGMSYSAEDPARFTPFMGRR